MHQTHWLDFPYKKSKKMILKECQEIANREGDYKDQITGIRFLDMNFLKNFDEAMKYIEEHDYGFYDQLAVPYKGPHGKQLWLVKIEYHC